MGQQIEELARFMAETGWDDIPEAIQRHAKLVVLDTLGVILAGTERPEVRALRERMGATAGTGATVYGRGWATNDPRTAALLNGIAGRSIELCEGLRMVSGQAAVQILPGVLAVGEAFRRSGKEMMAAFVLGYDVAARLCAAFTPWPLAHQNGQACMLAAVAAGARLRGLDAAGISRAMRIGVTLVLTPSYTNVVAGATALNVAGGMSGFAAALAPELALAGFEAREDAIEEALANLVGSGFDPGVLLQELGSTWHITQNYFRLYACCNPIHPALDALSEVLAALHPSASEIDRIDIATYRFASVMRNPEPPNYFASKYSLPHAAAAMVVTGSAGHASLGDAALKDPVIAELRHRVHITEDPAMSALLPVLRPARVSVTLTDGRVVTRAVESHKGDFNQPFAESEIRTKFRELAGEVLTSDGVLAVEASVDACEQWSSVEDLVALLRLHGREG
jgi:2-methylcitrate dehydratase PrpD